MRAANLSGLLTRLRRVSRKAGSARAILRCSLSRSEARGSRPQVAAKRRAAVIGLCSPYTGSVVGGCPADWLGKPVRVVRWPRQCQRGHFLLPTLSELPGAFYGGNPEVLGCAPCRTLKRKGHPIECHITCSGSARGVPATQSGEPSGFQQRQPSAPLPCGRVPQRRLPRTPPSALYPGGPAGGLRIPPRQQP